MHPTGPFFGGDYLGLVDIALIPFAIRYDDIIGFFRKFSFPGMHWIFSAVSMISNCRVNHKSIDWFSANTTECAVYCNDLH